METVAVLVMLAAALALIVVVAVRDAVAPLASVPIVQVTVRLGPS